LKKIIFIGVLAIVLQACNTIGVFEKTATFSDHAWASSNCPNFVFEIQDTSAYYNIFAVLRHTDAYHYNNIWLNISMMPPGDTATTVQQNFKLGDNRLGWLGTTMDDVIEHRMLITNKPVKLKKGNYTFQLQQVMREDPLQNILNAGIRVEKVIQ